MATSVVNPRAQFFANNGRPLIGGRIHTYVAGSSTRATTYKDAAKAQPNTNPIILDGRGEAQIYLAEGVEYKFVVEDSKGALIYTQEPVYGAIWPNAAEWPSDASLAYRYMLDAKAAAEGTVLTVQPFDTFAQMVAALPTLDDGVVEVSRDETRQNSRVRYRVVAKNATFLVNMDQLRLDLTNPEIPGSAIVTHQQAFAYAKPRHIADRLNDTLLITDIAGADPTGVAINSGPVNHAASIAGFREIDLAGGTYLVDGAYSNPVGRPFVNGAIVKAAPQGGRVRVNSYADAGKHFIGMEYLYRLFLRSRNGPVINGYIYGDSTSATAANGGGYAGTAFEPQNLIPKLASKYGNFKFILTNRAVGGTGVLDMNAVPDIDVVNGSTDLFIIKYGINDSAYGLDNFAAYLRSKLSGIRSSSGFGAVSALSIILIGPNATHDPEHNRSNVWYEQIRGIYEQAARDYKCAYFDAYGYMRDVEWAAAANGGLMMDDPYANGQGIHPKEIMQTMLWGKLVDYVFGSSAMLPYAERGWENLTMLNGWQAYGPGFAPPQARMVNGTIEVRGLMKGGTVGANTAVASLPFGMIPKYGEIFSVGSAGVSPCFLRVSTNGNIEQHNAASADYTSLAGIRFRID